MRRGLLALGLALLAGCGSSGGVPNPVAAGPRASEADSLAITEVVNAVVRGQAPGNVCNALLDPALVTDFYRTKPICRRLVAAVAGTTPRTAEVSDVDVDGARGTAVVTTTGGATDGASGAWNFVRTPAGWQVEDWSPEFLHSIFDAAFGAGYRPTGADDPLGTPRIRECVAEAFREKEDAQIRAAAKAYLRGGDSAEKLVADAAADCSRR